MFLITREGVEALREKLKRGEEIDRCKEELKKMREIKEAILWRAEEGQCCCCATDSLSASLSWEVQLLEEALEALDKSDTVKATAIIDSYVTQWE